MVDRGGVLPKMADGPAVSTQDAPSQSEPELFGTETMAELCARQGRLAEAIAIYRRLLAGQPDPTKLARWTERCHALERAQNPRSQPTPPPTVAPAPTAAPAPAAPPGPEDAVSLDV